MNDKKCYKCGSKVALIYEGKNEKKHYICIPCMEDISKGYGVSIMPFTKLELEKIHKGKKWTSIQVKEHRDYPFKNHTIVIYTEDYIFRNVCGIQCETMTDEVIKSEGFKTFDELIEGLKKRGFKNILGYKFRLYDLRKPI